MDELRDARAAMQLIQEAMEGVLVTLSILDRLERAEHATNRN